MLFLQKIYPLETSKFSISLESLIPDWAKELPVAVTVCDKEAIILYMNDKSTTTFMNSGGGDLVGKSLYDCHTPSSNEIIKELLLTGRSNIYTIEKNGTRKMICQIPWFQLGIIAGLVELSIVIPTEMPHFIRQ